MDFGLSEEQTLLQDTVERYLDEQCPLDKVREAADGDAAARSEIGAGLQELGIMQMMLPEAYGGAGLALLDAALVQELLGRHVAPVPFASHAVLGPLALMRAGNGAQQAAWLPGVSSGDVRFATALNEAGGAREGTGLAVGDDGRVTGKSLFVAGVESATHVLVLDQSQKLVIVDLQAPGTALRELKTIDRTRPAYELVLDNAAGEVLAASNSDTAGMLVASARVLLAADSLGAASAMIDQAVTYAGDRQQFGRVIASFQAVKHLCAEMAARLEPCRSLVWYAAYALDSDADDALLMSLLAKSHLAEVGQFVARTATEVHGGMGFTDLLGLHYWFKRIGANRQVLGGPERLRDEAARLQGWA